MKSAHNRFDKISAILLIGLLVFGVAQFGRALATIDFAQIPMTPSDVLTGKTASTLTDRIEKSLPARSSLIGLANGLRYRLTGGTGEQVRRGRDGWFFLAEELQFSSEAEAALRTRVALVTHIANLLSADGVRLIVALVPDKARIHAEQLDGTYPPYQAGRYAEALHALESSGVTVANLLPLFMERARAGEALYYRTDTHWNQRGASIAAAGIATVINSEGLRNWPTTPFETVDTGIPAERPGDLAKLMGVGDTPLLRPDFDLEAPVLVRKRENAGLQKAALFGDVELPVALVGTSYSLRANFHGFLQAAFGTEILNVARDGGGFLQSMAEYLDDESYRSSRPQIVIWELPERFLTLPLDVDQKYAKRWVN